MASCFRSRRRRQDHQVHAAYCLDRLSRRRRSARFGVADTALFVFHADAARPLTINRPWMLLLLLGVTATMWFYLDIVRRLPGTIILGKFPPVVVAFLGGTAFFYFLKGVMPALDVGPTLGNLNLIFVSPLFDHGGRTWHDIASIAWEVVPI